MEKITPKSNSRVSNLTIITLVFVFCLTVLDLVTRAGVYKDTSRVGTDAHVLYLAGKVWDKGGNPYSLSELKREDSTLMNHRVFAYPPTTAAPLKLYGKLPINWYYPVILFLDLLALIYFVYYGEKEYGIPNLWGVFALLVTIYNQYTIANLALGQVDLLILATMLVSWENRGRPIVGGLALWVACMKPTLTLPFLVLLLLEGCWGTILVAAVLSLFSSIPAFLPHNLIGGWVLSLQAYNNVNPPSAIQVLTNYLNIPSLIACVGITCSGMGAVYLIKRYNKRPLPIILCMPLLFRWSYHPYNNVLEIPLLIVGLSLCLKVAKNREYNRLIALITGIVFCLVCPMFNYGNLKIASEMVCVSLILFLIGMTWGDSPPSFTNLPKRAKGG